MKKIALLLAIVAVMIIGMGCQKNVQILNSFISQEDYENLPEDQQDSELDKARGVRQRKESK